MLNAQKTFESFFETVVGRHLNYAIMYDECLEWIKQNLNPEDVFSTDQLDKWAESEGYIKGNSRE